MIIGMIFAILSGAAMSIQGVFNTGLSERVGLFESNAFVQGTAFFLSLIVSFIFGRGNIGALSETPKLFLSGGAIGVLITVGVMLAIKNQGTTLAVSVILIAQLLTAAIIDAFGLFGAEKVGFSLSKYIALALMIGGVILFKK